MTGCAQVFLSCERDFDELIYSRAVRLVLLLVTLSLTGCPPPAACRPESCKGCCSQTAQCIEATTAAACGVGGSQCVACGATEACSAAGSCGPVAIDAGAAGRRLSYVNRFGWDGDGGTTSALQPDSLFAGAWLRGATGFAFVSGLVSESGSVAIAGVPDGPVLFQLDQQTFLVTDARETVLENVVGGRRGASRPDASTPITFEATGLLSADAGHRIRVFFTQDREAIGLEARAMPPLSLGGTTFSGTLDWARENGGRLTLPEASAGDEGWFAQLLEASLDGGLAERRLVAAGRFPPSTLTSGVAARLSTVVMPVAVDTVPLDVDTAAHRTLVAQFGNRPVAGTGFVLGVTVTPAPAPVALAPLTTHVLRVPEARAFPSSMALGNPFPSSWAALVDFRYQPSFLRRSITFVAGTRVVEPVALTRTRRLVPVLGAPRDANVNGRRLEFDVTGLGATPIVSWTAPSVGTPAWYRLRWFLVTTTMTAGQAPTVFWTKATRLEIPPMVLNPGDFYVLELAAVSTGDGRPGSALPLAEGIFVSGVLSP